MNIEHTLAINSKGELIELCNTFVLGPVTGVYSIDRDPGEFSIFFKTRIN